MTLAELLAALGDLSSGVIADEPAMGRAVRALAYDSRRVSPGSVFVAVRGQKADGAAFAAQALAKGALAVVAEAPPPPGVHATWVTVTDGRAAMARLAAAFYGRPSREMQVVGITGTNGKTTTAYVLGALFEAAGTRCGMLGTVVYRTGTGERAATRTTPEAIDIQQLLREMVAGGCGACVMEVSSHALALRRADEIEFAAAIFTNLTRDHLDFHRDMESYFAAKRRLFELLGPGVPAAINLDDPRGATLASLVSRPVTYAIDRPADVVPEGLAQSLRGVTFEARTPAGPVRIRSRLVGRPNVYNLLSAVTAAVSLGIPAPRIEEAIEALEGVPGRFQVVSTEQDDITVVVDYAHTDDALKNLLETARPLASQRLITVFGCGGDRDRTKRPLMGAVAARLSDFVIVTSDNPRSEDPQQIIDEIKRGIVVPPERWRPSAPNAPQKYAPPRATPHLAIVDRRLAIERAVEMAKPDDVVLLAGKGHEKYQVIGDRELPFDDVAVAREALARRRGRRA
ncbi:MAG TPA: UDP-N-acetylmuramoyl-L-alanyl-D-glutamate--2,6-diaminopimelate ligase [Vicinamibacterales bacterium]|nr:UDP-N-acetylmuramoyl-L-alanyl-D-glutamate--2,6-diaminopimelate ligase [Vicinamibacterales bacterium]